MKSVITIVRRELLSYFTTPIAFVFLVVFLVLAAAFSFYLGGFYERQIADLQPFFQFHPWLYLFLVPALSMRLWAEERHSGTLELLLTLPLTTWQAVLGKFIAAWLFLGLALLLTVPIWFTVNYLGEADNGRIISSYLGSWMLAGSLLAIGSCMSALSRNQVIAFVLTLVASFVLMLTGLPMILNIFDGWLSQFWIDGIARLSLINHFNGFQRGVIAWYEIVYFILMILFWLYATVVVLNNRRAG